MLGAKVKKGDKFVSNFLKHEVLYYVGPSTLSSDHHYFSKEPFGEGVLCISEQYLESNFFKNVGQELPPTESSKLRTLYDSMRERSEPKSKYNRLITGYGEYTISVDVYDVLKAFDVKCPALQHLIKKALCAGLRGHKDITTDLQDIIDSAIRAKELHNENLDN